MSRKIIRLTMIYTRLDEEIRAEMRRLAPRSTRVARLKKIKLAIKDQIRASTANSIAM